MTYILFEICVIYIILIDLPYWVRLVKWVMLRSILPNSGLPLLTLIER